VVTRERFAEGMTPQQYVDQMSVNREPFLRALALARIEPREVAWLEGLAPRVNVLVITEDWCGTSIAYVPPLLKLVEGRPDVEVRIFLRDESPDVMDQYLKRGVYRSIPVIVFFDAHMQELARFIEARAG